MGLDPTGIGTIATAAAKIIGLFKADPNIKVQGQLQLDETALQGQIQEVLAQIQVDAVEAASSSTFVAGWRPWIGWICGTALGIPVLIYLMQCVVMLAHGKYDLPAFNSSELISVVVGMLGLGGLRTYEKVQGVAGGSSAH